MARQKEFDENEVLEQATKVFWEHGYAATSIQNLVDRMNIHRGSLYATFKDKKTLFYRCLEHYDSKRQLLTRTDIPPIETIRDWFQFLVEAGLSSGGPRGCFIINTLRDIESHDPEINEAVHRSLLALENLLYAQIRRGQGDGSISPDLNARRVARSMVGTTVGMRSLSHLKPDRVFLQNIADSAISLVL